MATGDIIKSINGIDFQRIDLKQAESAQLMNRVDSKYILPSKKIFEIIDKNKDHYFVVEINNQVVHNYFTEYFDTPDLNMYMDHHNRRSKRYKLRIRTYNVSGDIFFEIKLKTPDGKTRKKRIEIDNIENRSEKISSFVSAKSPYQFNELIKTLNTDFNRLTLVSKNYSERVTIDLGLAIFIPDSGSVNLDYLSIIEIKQDKSKRSSQIARMLKELGVRPNGFSKYSIGQALLNEKVKRNNFKKTILILNKLKYE